MNAAVVLAAGLSSRFPGHKLLCMIGGKTLLRHTVERILASPEIQMCLVVAREPHKGVIAEVTRLDVEMELVDGPAAHSESLKAGLKALPFGVRRVMVALGDQPSSTDLVSRLMREAAFSGRDVLVPTYLGKRGNPVVFSSEFVPRLQALRGDSGARSLLELMPDVVSELELGDIRPPDLDTDADFRVVARYLKNTGAEG